MSVMDAALVFLWLGLMLTWVWGEVAGRIPRIKGWCVGVLSAVVHWADPQTKHFIGLLWYKDMSFAYLVFRLTL